MTHSSIRDAATIILVRRSGDGVKVLMGQRSARATFMPNAFVFPGGAIEPRDASAQFDTPLNPICRARLRRAPAEVTPEILAAAAIRELHEETGLALGTRHTTGDETQHIDIHGNAGAMTYFFRALTPPERPQRFDARFFLAFSDALDGDIDDFSQSDLELSHLSWLSIDDARALDLPLITDMVLAELAHFLSAPAPIDSVPFFHLGSDKNGFSRLV